MKKFRIVIASIVLLAALPASALAMGSGDKYSDFQTGLTYKVFKPSKILGLVTKELTLLDCQPGEEQWVYARYGGTVRYVEIMQTMAGVKCSDPGVSKYLRTIVINSLKAKVYVYCDPAKPATFKKCGLDDIARVGGYLMFTTKPGSLLKGTEIQVQGIGGVTYAQLMTVAKGLKAVG